MRKIKTELPCVVTLDFLKFQTIHRTTQKKSVFDNEKSLRKFLVTNIHPTVAKRNVVCKRCHEKIH